MAASPDQHDDNMRDEYDFRSLEGVVRGKYAAVYAEGRRVVRLDPDVATAFLNAAYRPQPKRQRH
ncbi:MAG: hypothetical protein FJ286_18260 [Planctomycetes bacterium]|nr:hypothetical protein [Planctomycetota bacterium]